MNIKPWPHEDLADDFERALERADTRTIGIGSAEVPCLSASNVAEVVAWHVSYHNEGKWQPGMDVGTELDLHALLRLTDGRWASVVAWNDYTGWDCQDGADVRIGPDKPSVIWHGLDSGSRELLGFPATRDA